MEQISSTYLQCVKLYDEAYERHCLVGLKEIDAQRCAIADGFEEAVRLFGIEQASSLWQGMQSAHVKRKSGALISTEAIAAVISASQSWNKSSGHAFEQSFCKTANALLGGTKIKFLLQKEVSELIGKSRLLNKSRDVTSIQAWIKSSAFDVFVGLIETTGVKIFGCVQCKTSIRDRVGRDREPSLHAMNDFFWSISAVVNGDFLNLPKFNAMVNGGTSDYIKNGWHGMYVYSDCTADDRIFMLNKNFAPLIDHAKSAAKSWETDRQWLDSDWYPKVENVTP